MGSFANVVIHRVPRRISIVTPRSRCPCCLTELSWTDNIPLVSWLTLKGKCRHCDKPISPRYPLVELINAALWAAVFGYFGVSWQLAPMLVFVTVLVIVSATDIDLKIIPNRVMLPASLIAIVLIALADIFGSDVSATGALAGAALYGLPMLALALAIPAGMGIGDVKLAGYLGLHLGALSLPNVLVGALSGFFLGGVTGVVLIALGLRGRKDPVPFGPFMAGGALLAVFAGEAIIRAWIFASFG